jgi:photosystem II stability/assembly factor-like uncharacterized protein
MALPNHHAACLSIGVVLLASLAYSLVPSNSTSAQSRDSRKYSTRSYPRKPKVNSAMWPSRGLDAFGHAPSLTGVPGPYRFDSYCSPNKNEIWTVGGQGEVLLLTTGRPTRRFKLESTLRFNGGLYGIYFNSEGFGWVVGDRGIIFHSPDNGNTWIEQSVGGDEILSAVTCVNNKTCWAVGGAGLILKTTDGGNVWTRSVVSDSEGLNAVDFIDRKNGWIVGTNGLVLRTRDGGVTWESRKVPLSCEPRCDKWGTSLSSVRFVNEKVGWVAASDQIACTEDGGETWKVIPIPSTEGNQVVCIIGLVSDDGKRIWAVSECQNNYFSKDGGSTWRKRNDVQLTKLTKLTKRTASVRPSKVPTVSGSTVGLQFSSVTPDLNGGVWITGSAWLLRGLMVNDRNGHTNATIIAGVRAVSKAHFVTPSIGWMIEARSLYRTADGGSSWQRVEVPDQSDVRSVHFSDVQDGWVGGWDGEIYHTEDAGQTWTKQQTGLDYQIQEIFSGDSVHGWAVAFMVYPDLRRKAALLKTGDGGANWEILSNEDADSRLAVHSVVFVNANEGWAIDNWQGNIVHSVDGGNTWTMQRRRDDHGWNSLVFVNDRQGWAVGDDGILHTSDGGETWNYQQHYHSGETYLEAIAFSDSDHGWAVGRDSIIRTTDGGITWKEIPHDWKRQIPTFQELQKEDSLSTARNKAH